MAFFERKRNMVKESCGESGIRTHGTISDTHAFQACSFSHSDISPVITKLLIPRIVFRGGKEREFLRNGYYLKVSSTL